MKRKDVPIALCTAHPEFAGLSEDEIWNAVVNAGASEGPVMTEITRLGAEFLAGFNAYAERRGGRKACIRILTRCPIESVAVLATLHFVEAHKGLDCSMTVH